MAEHFLIFTIPLVIGYLLDLLLGDPRWLPHPIRLFGTVITKGESLFNTGNFKFLKGAIFTIILCVSVFFFFYVTQNFVLKLNHVYYYLLTGIFVFYGLANKSLLQEGKEVFIALKSKGLEAGRKRLSWIVGRDTSCLDENQIRTAVFETLSENLSDGVIAPLFYYALGGLPAMMAYKMINTLDSMIGYKNEKYILFGKFSAHLDDVANYLPARITALLMVLVTLSKNGFVFVIRYGHLHASPNSGYPEAALAGILKCRFGGPNVYAGILVEKPYIGQTARAIQHKELSKVMYINHFVTLLMVMGSIAFCYFIQ
jgi:adenosylcobinamide-phosphate synthase